MALAGLSPSPALAKAIKAHIEALSAKQKELFMARQDDLNLADEQLLQRITERDKEHSRSSWYRKDDMENKLDSTFSVLKFFTTSVSAEIPSIPEAKIALGALRVVLVSGLKFFQSFSKLSKMIDRISCRLKLLNDYARDHRLDDQTRIQDCVAKVYGDVLKFYGRAHNVDFDEKTGEDKTNLKFRRFFIVQWRSFEDDSGPIESEMQSHLKDLLLASSKMTLGLTMDIWSNLQANDRAKLLDWLTLAREYDCQAKQDARISEMVKGPAQWFLATDLFRDWCNKPSPQLLWSYGGAGLGKSFLSAKVLEHVSIRLAEDNVGVAFFYYDHKNPHGQTIQHVLHTMLKQLCRDCKVVPKQLLDLWQGRRHIKVDDFIQVVRNYNELYIVIDALDECLVESRPEVLGILRKLSGELTNVKVCVMSRRHEDIALAMKQMSARQFQLQKNDLDPDIRLYIEHTVKQLRQGKDGVQLPIRSDDVYDRVVETLIEKADGMILWVSFQLRSLCEMRKTAELNEALQYLPKGLDMTYQRMIDQIWQKHDTVVQLALEALRIVVCAQMPLKVQELQYALALQAGMDLESISGLLDGGNDIIDACSDLLVARDTKLIIVSKLVGMPERRSRKTVREIRPAHFSVQQYLASASLLAPSSCRILDQPSIEVGCHFHVAEVCVRHLSQKQQRQGLGPFGPLDPSAADPFFVYAALFFDTHILRS